MNSMIKLAGASLAVMTLGLATAAFAHPPQGGEDDRFERADLDGNGVITAEEREAVKAEMFDELDADGNGSVTEAEMQAAHEARKAEHDERRARFRERMEERRAEWSERGDDRRAEIDTNSDGEISRAEFFDHESSLTEMLDANGDGDITREEAEAARKAMHDERRSRWKERSDD